MFSKLISDTAHVFTLQSDFKYPLIMVWTLHQFSWLFLEDKTPFYKNPIIE